MGFTIMVVDDSASLRQMVSFTLNEAGYEVVEAVDGDDALRKLEQKPVNMMITDLNMPKLDGLELIRRVRVMGAYRFMPIIMLSTEFQEDKKQAGRSAGATGWIVKPFQPPQLLGVIRRVLGCTAA